MQIFATDGSRTKPEVQNENVELQSPAENADIENIVICEVPEKRDEYTKTYKKGNNTYTSVISSAPVHYLKDGKWEEIDNTLTEKQKDGQTVYTNADNPVNIDFPETISDDNKIVIENDNYSIKFSVNEINDSQIGFIDNTPIESGDENSKIIQEDLQKQESSVQYENVFFNTDIQYTVLSKSIKEDIILNSANAIRSSYSFSISSTGVTASVKDGAVNFINEKSELIYTIPAPVMNDDAGGTSTDIAVDLSSSGNGEYTLTYTPSAEWLNSDDRVYPVTLDPMINVTGSEWITDTYVASNDADINYSDSISATVSNNAADNIVGSFYGEAYFKFNLAMMDSLSDDITPTNVEFVTSGMLARNLAAYEISSSCDLSDVTYNTKPSLSQNVIDYYTGTGASSPGQIQNVRFNITKLFSEWLTGAKTNNGIAIAGFDKTASADGLLALSENTSYSPKIYIDYIETCGYNDVYDYQTQDLGRAGTSYINNFTRDLFIKRDDISLSGNIMPVTISFMYNPALIQKTDKYAYISGNLSSEDITKPIAVYGNGWLTNFNRMLYLNKLTGAASYTDENGAVTNFIASEDENNNLIYVEEYSEELCSKGYSLDISAVPEDFNTNGLEYVKLITPNGETESFDMLGRLVKIQKTSRPDQSIDIHYVTDYTSIEATNRSQFFMIDYITDGVGRKFQFSYNADTHLLSQIFCKTADGTEIKVADTAAYLRNSYTYTNGNLTRVTYNGARYADYTYNSGNLLKSAENNQIYKLKYYFDSNNKITSVTEEARKSSSDDYSTGNTLRYQVEGTKQTKIFDDDGNINSIMQFDSFGRIIGSIDDKGNYSYQSYDNGENNMGMPSSGNIKVSSNLLDNKSFENGITGWTADNITEADIVTTENHSNEKSLKISSEASATKGVSQEIYALNKKMLTFSAYVKAAETNVSNELTMKIKYYQKNSPASTEETRKIAAVAGDFSRYSVTLDAHGESYDYVKVSIGLAGSKGEFYVDSLQLEEGAGAGEYDYLTNGTLTGPNNEVTGWTTNSVLSYFYEKIFTNQYFSTRHYADEHKSDLNKSLSQTVTVNGKQNDVLRFGGWVKSYVTFNDGENSSYYKNNPNDLSFANDRFTGLKLQYTYLVEENGEQVEKTETVMQKINQGIAGWQYVSLSTALKGDCTNVTVSFETINNPNDTAIVRFTLNKFDGYTQNEDLSGGETTSPEQPALDLCVCGESCAYGDGCTCSCASAAECTCTQCKGCPCESCTQLDCACRCESEETCTCPQCKKKFNITYDDFGNLLSMSINGYDLNSLLSMYMSRTYSSDGNYQTSQTNENGKKTQYLYDQASGYLKKMTDPRGNDTNYTYFFNGNLSTVSTPVSGLVNSSTNKLTASYSYDAADRLTKIYHNNFSYHIGYDAWGNITRICVGNLDNFTGANDLAKYGYGTGKNRNRLECVYYGNNDFLGYTYDSNGNLSSVTGAKIAVENGEVSVISSDTVSEYAYNSLGNVSAACDYLTERIVYYNDNSVEIYCSSGLEYKASYDADGNMVEVINGETFVNKQYESEKIEATNETVSKSAVTANSFTLGMSKLTDFGGRLKQKTVMSKDPTDTQSTGDFSALLTDYTYKTYTKDGKTYSTGQIDTMKNTVSYGANMVGENIKNRYNYAYDYDNNNNITDEYSVSADGVKTRKCHYTYDEANQLTQVIDFANNKTYVYKYDIGGNRVSTDIYNSSSAVVGSTTPAQSIAAEYGNGMVLLAPWNDRLKSYNGKAITYDAAGNPTSYDGKTYEWTGKQLTKVTAADGSYTTYNYDAEGLRTKKCQYSADGTMDYQVGYVWSDGKIITQSLGLIVRGTSGGNPTETQINIDSKYVYEEGSNTPYAAMFMNSEYLLVKNAQGDVTAVVDSRNGETLVEYEYDPWGQVTSTYCGPDDDEITKNLIMTIVNAVCPLTYRGYNYDFTTGLYYLQSRYYNPEWGRFLNVDDVKILSTSAGDPLAANPYLYCSNNPVNRVDYTGKLEVTLDMFLTLFYMSVVPHMLYMLQNEGYLIPYGYGNNQYYDIHSIEVKFISLYNII